MTAELAARRTAAAAALTDYDRWTHGEVTPGEWPVWTLRLAVELGSLLEQLADEDQADGQAAFAADAQIPDQPPWVNPITGQPSCPCCAGTGHYAAGPDEECALCLGRGVVSDYQAESFFATLPEDQARPAGPRSCSGVRDSGAAEIDLEDVGTVLAALADAATLLEERAGRWCDDCAAHPAECCGPHADDLMQATIYRALSSRLAGER